MTEKTCPECKGEGLVTMTDELPDGTEKEWVKLCPNCKGNGKIEDDEDNG